MFLLHEDLLSTQKHKTNNQESLQRMLPKFNIKIEISKENVSQTTVRVLKKFQNSFNFEKNMQFCCRKPFFHLKRILNKVRGRKKSRW